MSSNFSFLKDKFPVLAGFGTLAEQYCYTDANSCLMKLGMMGETIVNLIFSYDRMPLPGDNRATVRISVLLREGLITRDLSDILHALRIARNKAVHENFESVEEAQVLLPLAHKLSEWFMQTYGDWECENRPFVMPEKETAPVKEPGKETEEKLLQEAEAAAAASPEVAPDTRRERARRAAGRLSMSEEETRYLIDGHLRQVGWEADTKNLRYSKGSRPKKGTSLAIAEWPTDSATGKKGYADYALFVEEKLFGIVEAKAQCKDIPSVIDGQCKDYARHIREEDEKYLLGQ